MTVAGNPTTRCRECAVDAAILSFDDSGASPVVMEAQLWLCLLHKRTFIKLTTGRVSSE
jgi:hypothetical protein